MRHHRPYILEVYAAGRWHVAVTYATAEEAERVIQSLPGIRWRLTALGQQVQISVDSQEAAE